MDRPAMDAWQRADECAAVRLVVVFRGERVLVYRPEFTQIHQPPSTGRGLVRLASLLSVIATALLLRTTVNLANVGLVLLLMDALMAAYLFRWGGVLVHQPVVGLLGAMIDIRVYLKWLVARRTHAA